MMEVVEVVEEVEAAKSLMTVILVAAPWCVVWNSSI